MNVSNIRDTTSSSPTTSLEPICIAADTVNKVINHFLSRHRNCKLTGRESYSVIDTVTP